MKAVWSRCSAETAGKYLCIRRCRYVGCLWYLSFVSVCIFTMAEPLITWSPAMFFYWLLSHSMHCIGSNHRQQQLFNIFLTEKEKHSSAVTWTSKNYSGPWQEFETWTFVLEMWWTLGLNEYTVGEACFPGMICLNCELCQMGTGKWSKASFSLFSSHPSIHPPRKAGCHWGFQYAMCSHSVSLAGHRPSHRLQPVLHCR